MNHRLAAFVLAAFIFFADQISKWFVLGPLQLEQRGQHYLLPFFQFTYTRNYGISGGFLTADSDQIRWVLVAFTAAIAVGVAYWLVKEKEKWERVALGMVLGGALGEVKPLIQDGSVTVSDINSAERAVERNMLLEITTLKRGLAVLATVGATAPFVGLLGTVVGVIVAFTGIAATGGGGIAGVSAGIAEALVETALGLFVAIPAVWFYNFLTSRLEYFNVEMDNSSSELVDYFIKKTA